MDVVKRGASKKEPLGDNGGQNEARGLVVSRRSIESHEIYLTRAWRSLLYLGTSVRSFTDVYDGRSPHGAKDLY